MGLKYEDSLRQAHKRANPVDLSQVGPFLGIIILDEDDGWSWEHYVGEARTRVSAEGIHLPLPERWLPPLDPFNGPDPGNGAMQRLVAQYLSASVQLTRNLTSRAGVSLHGWLCVQVLEYPSSDILLPFSEKAAVLVYENT